MTTIDTGTLVYAVLIIVLGAWIRGAFSKVANLDRRVNGHDTAIAVIETKQTSYDADMAEVRRLLKHIDDKLDGKADKSAGKVEKGTS